LPATIKSGTVTVTTSGIAWRTSRVYDELGWHDIRSFVADGATAAVFTHDLDRGITLRAAPKAVARLANDLAAHVAKEKQSTEPRHRACRAESTDDMAPEAVGMDVDALVDTAAAAGLLDDDFDDDDDDPPTRFERLFIKFRSDPFIQGVVNLHEEDGCLENAEAEAGDAVLSFVDVATRLYLNDFGARHPSASTERLQALGSPLATICFTGWYVRTRSLSRRGWSRAERLPLLTKMDVNLLREHVAASMRDFDFDSLDDDVWYCLSNYRGSWGASALVGACGRPIDDTERRDLGALADMALQTGYVLALAERECIST